MTNIEICTSEIDYYRNIEFMGEGLVFIEISNINPTHRATYHFMFNDNRKPPLDVAITTNKSNIEYISYFIMDEIIKCENPNCNIIYHEENIKISDEFFNSDADVFCKDVFAEFDTFYINSDILILYSNFNGVLNAYQLNSKNYILVDFKGMIAGIVLKSINDKEIQILTQAVVI